MQRQPSQSALDKRCPEALRADALFARQRAGDNIRRELDCLCAEYPGWKADAWRATFRAINRKLGKSR